MNRALRTYVQPTSDGESELLLSDVPDRNLMQKTGRWITCENPAEIRQ